MTRCICVLCLFLLLEPCYNIFHQIIVSLIRGPGAYGDVTVDWQIVPRDATTFTQFQGQITFPDGQEEIDLELQVRFVPPGIKTMAYA